MYSLALPFFFLGFVPAANVVGKYSFLLLFVGQSSWDDGAPYNYSMHLSTHPMRLEAAHPPSSLADTPTPVALSLCFCFPSSLLSASLTDKVKC